MTALIIICSTIIAIFGLYLYSEHINPYVDEMVDEQDYIHTTTYDSGRSCKNDFVVRQYKRTYKNGKVIFFQKEGK